VDKAPQPLVESQQTPVEPPSASSGGVPDWFKTLIPFKAGGEIPIEASHPPVEPQASGVDATPDWLKPLTQAENVGHPDVIPEPAPVETPSVESEPGSIPAGISSGNEEASPDLLTGISARSDAAALTAKAVEQPVTNQPVSELSDPPELADQAPLKPPIPNAGTSSETFQPTGEVKPLNINDDAFSWLESLAAKQGAKPEELLTNPEERSGETPDSLRQPGKKSADSPVPATQEPVLTHDVTNPLKTLSGFETAPFLKTDQTKHEDMNNKDKKPSSEPPVEIIAQPGNQPDNGEDDTMAWLEKMAADQGTKQEEPLVGPVADLGTTPGWIQKL
jgi:hypothetical protein